MITLSDATKTRLWKEAKGLLQAFLLVMFIRTFFFQAFNIPSGSMIPTLLVGDYLFVNKYCYGYGNPSFPFGLNLVKERIWSKPPERGDVVVFFNPKHTHLDEKKSVFGLVLDYISRLIGSPIGLDYVKRVIGLPGDTIQMVNGVLHINGKPVTIEKVGTYSYTDEDGRLIVLTKYYETLPNGVKHVFLKQVPFGQASLDNTPVYTVPEGHYFMMGDNRDRSQDSRVSDKVGFVSEKELIGRAEIIFFSTDAKLFEPWRWIFGARYSRFLNVIR